MSKDIHNDMDSILLEVEGSQGEVRKEIGRYG